MSTKTKTSLSIVCFYTLFLITSCVNSKQNKVTFKSKKQESQAEVAVIYRTETSLSIELTCVSKAQGIDIQKVHLVCLNPNPIGHNGVKVLDTADHKPVQIYNGEYNGHKIRVILPYGNLEKTNRDLVLSIFSASKAGFEMKLSKSNSGAKEV